MPPISWGGARPCRPAWMMLYKGGPPRVPSNLGPKHLVLLERYLFLRVIAAHYGAKLILN